MIYVILRFGLFWFWMLGLEFKSEFEFDCNVM